MFYWPSDEGFTQLQVLRPVKQPISSALKRDGQFDPEKGGQFDPDLGGQFRPERGGQFVRIFQFTTTYHQFRSARVPSTGRG